MRFKFNKYQGTGNDFIIIDNRDQKIKLTEKQIQKLCNRRFGIGADGLMLLQEHQELNFSMKYYNADGKESTMCGNGGRCLVQFAKTKGIVDQKALFSAIDGTHEAIINEHTIALQMQDIKEVNRVNNNYYLNSGSPHYVTFKEKIDQIDIYHRGREIRYSSEFEPKGTNVNFVEFQKGRLYVRTYERGVEDETLSCGTGVTASAICASIHTKSDKNSYPILTRGGELKVSFKKVKHDTFTDIWLTGPATFVFEGEIEI